MILLAMVCRLRRRGARQLRVAVTSKASLVLMLANARHKDHMACLPWLLIEDIEKPV